MFSNEAMTLLKNRYLRPHESPDDMFLRVARHVAQGETMYGQNAGSAEEAYFMLMKSLAFLPNTPTLINSGKKNAQLAACFVLPVEDSLAAIFETIKNAALVHQSGGGTGFSFSKIRPHGEVIASTGGKASGPLLFIKIFDVAAEVVKQGAVRSGANMAVLRVDHPDIEAFITAKSAEGSYQNFNFSVAITNEFMQKVEKNEPFQLVNPYRNESAGSINARKLFRMIAQQAWHNGEPGLFFIDTVNQYNPLRKIEVIETPNPCGEQPLLSYESCTLGSINLTRMLRAKQNGYELDYDIFGDTIRTAVRFLDNVLDVNHYPLDSIARQSLATRKIGLGIMGLADLFILKNIPYASRPAVELTRDIMKFVTQTAKDESQRIAGKRGPFPLFAQSEYAANGLPALRNATVTTVAPTGSISIIAGCSSGIEPLFALATTKKILGGERSSNISSAVMAYLETHKLCSEDILSAIQTEGSVKNTNLSLEDKEVLMIAKDIPPLWHVHHLAAAQQYTDNGVSKTVNLPNGATVDDVETVFTEAFRSGCKGITVYRDASRKEQVIYHGINCSSCAANG